LEPRIRRLRPAWAACVFALFLTNESSAQDAFTFSGLLYADYAYTAISPDAVEEGNNGFGYRRVYFTADFVQSERFSGRFRLEATDTSENPDGKPAPFVKDLYVRWHGALGEGHDLIMGVSGPPSFEVSEKVWGYRSLLKTIQDQVKIVSSRDMGIAVKGRLNGEGTLRYGVMFANNESVSAENDKHKRVYGQLEFYPSESVSLTLGGDYASLSDGHTLNVNAFAGYTSDPLRLGVEAFLSPRSYDDVSDELSRTGATVFVIANPSERISAIFRGDRYREEFLGQKTTETLLLAGLGLHVDTGVDIIPNVLVEKSSQDDDPLVTARVTLNVNIK
jgi:hypothetical protein